MVVPAHKLPALLATPVRLSGISRLVFSWPARAYINNNPRHFYKTQGPVLKYYNPHLKIELKVADSPPKLEVFEGTQLLAEIDNSVPSAAFTEKLLQLQESLGPKS